MKKIKLILLFSLLYGAFGHAQNSFELQKVDSPFRLVKGVIIKSDLRMTATILEGIKQNTIAYNARENAIWTNGQSQSDRMIAIFSRNQLSPNNPNINFQPAIVMDGFLIDNNSPRFIIGQSPFAKVPWRAPY